ncbi:MAG: VIT domain-containing protein [Janthinobacterium lividum]
MPRIVVAALVALLSSAAAHAQEAPGPTPALRGFVGGVRDPAHTRDLGLRRLSVAIAIRGAVAETTVEADFLNATGETLEGDFRFRLPSGAVVTGYALDVNGRMIDGVLVDRPRAKAVYDARVRVRVDPGVAEVTPDNLFHAQVNPILPGRGRTIRLRFAMPVSASGYRLPIAAEAPAQGWRVAVSASGAEAAPSLRLPGGARVVLGRTPDGFASAVEQKRAPLSGEILVDTPSPSPPVLVSEHASGERDVQIGGALAGGDAARGGRLRVYWDRSRARLDGDVAADIALVQRLIERLRPTAVELVAFNSSGALRTTQRDGDAAAAWLGTVRYRGATSYAPVAGDAATDRCLLFAEGGPAIDRAAGFAPRCRLDAVSSAAGADRGWLRHVAGAAGGNAYALHGDGYDLARRLVASPAGLIGVADRDGRPLPFVPLEAPTGRWLALVRAPAFGPIMARLAGDAAVREQAIAVDGPAAPFDAAGALIAADELATLGATEQRERYVALSRRYGVASPSLSFLVLENAADYVAARVEPPAGYPADARDDFLRARKAAEAETASKATAWVDHVADEWAETVAWWNRRFDPAAVPKRIATSRSFDRTAPPVVSPPPIVSTPAPAPSVAAVPPLPPPPPPPPPPPSAPAPADDVVVTSSRVGQEATRRGTPTDAATAIHIEPWQPDRPYLELYDGRPSDFDERFLEAEKRHGDLPIFYLDTAEWMRRHGRGAGAAEMVLSALALPTANEVTLGIVADRLERYGAIDRAIELRERQAALDPERPQPRRLLALALARRAVLRPATARADLQRAAGLLYAVATTPHDDAWNGIETIALIEANALLPRLRRLGGTMPMDPRLVKLLDVDARVVIDWTTDGSDMDLWVDEPDGERAIYNNQRTAIGGHLSTDMTRGYGPEEYMLRRAPAGTYLVQANVFAPDRLDPNGATLLTAHLFRDFGRPTQREEAVDVEVTRDDKGAKQIGRIVVPAGRDAAK